MASGLNVYDSFESALEGCGEYVTLLHGVSMYPLLRSCKDPVLIHPLSGEAARYDIVVYAKPDRFVVHRVLEVRPECYVIRGDNCVAKEYVPREAVRGIVAGFWRSGRYISVSNRWYRAYSRLWVAINPLVRLCHLCRRYANAARLRLHKLFK